MTTTGQTFSINTLSNYSFLSNDGDKEIILSNQGLILKRDLLTTPIETIITPLDITDTNTGNTITMDKLTYLPIGLASLEPPPNATTLNINNTILLDVASSPSINYNTIDNTSLTITDTTYTASLISNELNLSDSVGETTSLTNIELNIQNATGNQTILNNSKLQIANSTTTSFIELNASNQLWIENADTFPIILNSSNAQITMGDVGNAGNLTKIAVDDTTRTNEINSVDIISNVGTGTSPYFTLPIQFTNKATGNYTYTNPNTWEMVFNNSINIPLEQFTLTNGYNTWRMDFAINCWNMTIQTDKAYAMYIEIRDVNGGGVDYTGFLFNQTTPYTTHKNNSTYTATNSQIENYIYTDYFDLSGVTGNPLEIRLFRYADNAMTCDFSWLLTLSKNNLV